MFPYYRANARWTALRSVRLPIAAIVGSRDEYLDRRPEALIDAFRQNASRAPIVHRRDRRDAAHSFTGHERPAGRRHRALGDGQRRAATDLISAGATKVLSTRPRAAAGSTPLAAMQGVASARGCGRDRRAARTSCRCPRTRSRAPARRASGSARRRSGRSASNRQSSRWQPW